MRRSHNRHAETQPSLAAPVSFNDEARHVQLVAALTDQIYPAFDQTAYMASSLAPRKLAPLAPSSHGPPPHTPSKRASKIPSSSPTIQSGQGFSSELDFSDLPSSSQASSSATPTKFRPVRAGPLHCSCQHRSRGVSS